MAAPAHSSANSTACCWNQLIGSRSPSGRYKVSAEASRRGLVCTTRTGPTVSRSGRAEVPADLLRVDLLHRRALVVARDLPLGGAPLGNREPLGRAELLGDRTNPLAELLEPGPRGDRFP